MGSRRGPIRHSDATIPSRRQGKVTVAHRFTAHLVDKRYYPSFLWDTAPVPDRRSDDAAVDGRDRVASGPAPRQPAAGAPPGTPGWFEEFVIDRATGKPSVHTVKAYRQDFAAIAAVLTGGRPAELALADITRESMRAAFAAYAPSHEPASIRRCWSTWNVVCDFLYTAELIAANPMPLVGRPKPAKTLPKALPQPAVAALIAALQADRDSPRATAWFERDLALILTALLAGLRADELRRADVGDIRTATGGGAVIGVRGKGSKDRSVPIEADLLSVIEDYLDSRARRFPTTTRSSAGQGLSYARPGDVIVVVGIDRLGRNAAEVMLTIRDLGERGVVLRSLREGIDTSNATGRMIAGVLASLAELELELGRERRAAAKAARKSRGLPIGRPRKLSGDKLALAERMRAGGEPVPVIAATLRVSVPTMYRLLAERSSKDEAS